MSETQLGCVKWFNGKRGYGFITNVDTGDDVFVHHSGLTVNVDCWKNLFKGEYVEYSLETSEDGKSTASNVTGVRGGKLMCESNHTEGSRRRRTSDEGEGEGEGETTTE